MPNASISLQELGWSNFFQQQLSLEELESTVPVRLFALNRHLAALPEAIAGEGGQVQ